MSIDNITEKILSEANQEAERILEKAGNESSEILQKAQVQAGDFMIDAEERGRADSQLLKSRKISVAELEARKMRLAAKQQAISRCFDLALDKLSIMNEDDYIALLAKAVIETGVDGGELLLNEKDRSEVGKKIIKMVNASKDGEKITLSDKTINVKGGFVLKHGSLEINCTLETMVNAVRESVTPRVVEILFN